MKKRWFGLVSVALLGLVGCGTGGSGGGGGGGDTERQVSGYVFAPLRGGVGRAVADQQTPLAGMVVNVYLLPGGGTVYATATTDNLGRFIFSTVLGNPVPMGQSLLLVATGNGRTLSGVLNSSVGVQSFSLSESTHLAALAVRAGEGASISDDRLGLFEIAARQALDDALGSSPLADFTLNTQQTAAGAVAATARGLVTGGQVQANQPPVLSNALATPTQLTSAGGTVHVEADVSDADHDPVAVTVLSYRTAGLAPGVVQAQVASGHCAANVPIAPNTGTSAVQYEVVLMADDGVNPPYPASVRLVSVLPEGHVTLDILAETLYDEPASRQQPVCAILDRMRARVVPAGTRRRQVNANQSIRGVTVTLDDDNSITGATGNTGLLDLSVPISAAADGLLGLRASINGRATYHQYLVLPQGSTLRDGDRIEIDLVLAPETDWITFGAQVAVSGINFAKVPVVSIFNVRSDLSLTGVTPAGTRYRPLTDTPRADDGDFFAAGFDPGTATASGTFTSMNSNTAAFAFGPTQLSFSRGEVGSVSALLAPGQ